MKRLLLMPLVLATLTLFAWADRPASAPIDPSRLQQLRRNLPLVEKLVNGGLRLAEEKEPLKRAESCNLLAEHLATEIQEAAKHKEGDRALEMGTHLHLLLKHGIAANLRTVSIMATAGSDRARELRRVGDRSEDLVNRLEEELDRAAAGEQDDMGRARKTIHDGGAAIEAALEPQGPAKLQEKEPRRQK